MINVCVCYRDKSKNNIKLRIGRHVFGAKRLKLYQKLQKACVYKRRHLIRSYDVFTIPYLKRAALKFNNSSQ